MIKTEKFLTERDRIDRWTAAATASIEAREANGEPYIQARYEVMYQVRRELLRSIKYKRDLKEFISIVKEIAGDLYEYLKDILDKISNVARGIWNNR
jgi:small-conductance mechanosensitive channel